MTSKPSRSRGTRIASTEGPPFFDGLVTEEVREAPLQFSGLPPSFVKSPKTLVAPVPMLFVPAGGTFQSVLRGARGAVVLGATSRQDFLEREGSSSASLPAPSASLAISF
jgi:hypothetical protein